MAEILIEIIHVFVAFFIVLVVLVQGGNSGGMGAAFGGGSSAGVFGATGAQSLLGKLTYVASGIFMVTSITLTVMQGHGGDIGLKEKLKAAAGEQAPATPTGDAPAAAPANAAVPPAAAPPAAAPTPAPVPGK